MGRPESSPLPEAVDIVVVGAGVIGLSIAFEAASRGHRVVLIDKDTCGGGATPVAAGMLAPVSEAEPTLPQMITIGLESCRLYPGFIDRVEAASGLDCGYRGEGSLSIALDRDQMEELEHRAASHAELGLSARRLSGRQVREMEPALSPRAVGGLLTDIDRQVDPRALSRALIAATKRHDAIVAEATELVAVEYSDSGAVAGVVLRAASAGTPSLVRTQALVLCAGVWTRELVPELSSLPLRPVKGQVVRLGGNLQLKRVVTTPDVYLVPRKSGELVVGASIEEQGFDRRATAGITMDLLVHAWRALPSIYDLEIEEINVGFRPALRDHLPAIGPLAAEGVHVATGHYRNGIMLAPVTAKYLVETIETGVPPQAMRPFDPLRFAAEVP